jgi:hypothetical protein
MKYFALGLLFLGAWVGGPRLLITHAQTVQPAIPATDPDFSVVIFPDTQYYYGSNSYVLTDQVNWVVAHKSSLNIKMVVGMGDIVDGGGYPVDALGNIVGTCANPLRDSNWQTQWQQARAAVNTLNSNGIYYQPTIGNHDYDCEGDRPQPRGASNYFNHFGNLSLAPTAYIRDSAGNRTPNFYKIMQIGATRYMLLSLELFPRAWVVAAANNLISAFNGPVIVATHAYLANDGSGPTFGSSFAAGSAYPLCSGFPITIYGCLTDSIGSYKPVGGGTDGIGLWYQFISQHPNIFMTLSGHVRNPSPGNYPNVPNYNGVGHVNCAVQSWTTLCSTPYRPIQILSDFQGQGANGYFGYGYLRILTVSPSRKTVSVFTYSPSVANTPGKFPAGMPAYKTDAHDQYTLNFPNTFGGPNKEVTHIASPLDGSHVARNFGISAVALGPDVVSRMQIYVDGVKQADYATSVLPSGASVNLSSPGLHRVAVQAYDTTTATWVKSILYVTSP